jgi:predicted dehydrogenase
MVHVGSVGIRMLGSGFVRSSTRTAPLRPNARVVAGRVRAGRREAFGRRSNARSDPTVCADPVDLVVVSLPNQLHLGPSARRATARPSPAKPLGRNETGPPDLRLVRDAGVYHAYLENVVYGTEMVRMREMVEAGAIGRPTTFRAREGHSGPHAAHFWDAELAGGGALLDMASHGAEAARFVFGKDAIAQDVFAWGATLVHTEKTTGEDNAIMVIRFADGRAATMDVSWSSKGGLEGRFEVYGDAGRIIQDMTSTPVKAFIERPAGYLGERSTRTRAGL